MIFFSPKFYEEQYTFSNYHFSNYFNWDEMNKRVNSMVKEILTYNLLTTKEAIKIVKICNADPLRNFSISEIRRHLISNE